VHVVLWVSVDGLWTVAETDVTNGDGTGGEFGKLLVCALVNAACLSGLSLALCFEAPGTLSIRVSGAAK